MAVDMRNAKSGCMVRFEVGWPVAANKISGVTVTMRNKRLSRGGVRPPSDRRSDQWRMNWRNDAMPARDRARTTMFSGRAFSGGQGPIWNGRGDFEMSVP
jgi:hypothetical protein